MREIQGGVSSKGSIEALISPFRPLAQYQRARQSFSELRQGNVCQSANFGVFFGGGRTRSAGSGGGRRLSPARLVSPPRRGQSIVSLLVAADAGAIIPNGAGNRGHGCDCRRRFCQNGADLWQNRGMKHAGKKLETEERAQPEVKPSGGGEDIRALVTRRR